MEYIQTPVKIDDLRVGETLLLTRGTHTRYMGRILEVKDDKVLVKPLQSGYFLGWYNYKTSFYRVIEADQFSQELTKLSQL